MLPQLDIAQALQSNDKLQQLIQELKSCGGRAVAELLHRAVQQASTPEPPTENIEAELCRDACWEKLHTGSWAEVSVVWRDAYTAASLLSAGAVASAAHLLQAPLQCLTAAAATSTPTPGVPQAAAAPGRTPLTGQQSEQQETTVVHRAAAQQVDSSQPQCGGDDDVARPHSQSHAHGDGRVKLSTDLQIQKLHDADACAEAMRQLDMATLLGGLQFRPLLDACIAALQQDATVAAALSSEAHENSAGTPPGSRKRQRLGRADCNNAAYSNVPVRRQPYERTDAHAAAGTPTAVPLPPGALQAGHLVHRQPLPSLESFFEEFMGAAGGGRPVIITDGMEHWPARQRWADLSYLRAIAGTRTVPVEVGKHYLAEGWGQRLMTMSEFLDHHILASSSSSNPGAGTERGYLAQHELFEQIPALRADICEPEYCALGAGGRTTVNAWFGPPGTVTPLHTDPYHNLLAQVVGRKYVRLYPPDATPQLYPFEKGFTTNCSQVDVDAPDLQKHPHFAGLPHIDCVLAAGEMLYIPPRWWHFVKSLSVSFSVSFWWK